MLRAVLPVTVDALVDDPAFAISPNGQRLAYVAADGTTLLLRDLPSGETRVLSQGLRVSEPFFSPDSQQVAFVVGATSTIRTGVWGAMERIAVGGGAPVKVLDGIASMKGASWSDDGWIYYSPAPAAGLWRVRSEGGTPERLTVPDAQAGEKTHRRPFALPGGKAVLFVVGTSRITSFDDARIEALSIADKSRHRLVEGGTAPEYLAALGQLAYVRNGSLVLQPFDADRLELGGPPVTVADGISEESVNGVARYSISSDGTLVSLPASAAAHAELVSLDRQGRATTVAQAPLWIQNGALSPDGTRTTVHVRVGQRDSGLDARRPSLDLPVRCRRRAAERVLAGRRRQRRSRTADDAYLKGLDVMTAAVSLGAGVTIGVPAKLFTLTPDARIVAVTPDGRFLAVRQDQPAPQSPGIVVNWFEDVRRMAASGRQAP